MREEDLVDTGGEQPEVGTPPRAWGGRLFLERARTRRGNTPTCVGRTNDQYGKTPEAQEHPHVRGEDLRKAAEKVKRQGTPPRAWGGQEATCAFI